MRLRLRSLLAGLLVPVTLVLAPSPALAGEPGRVVVVSAPRLTWHDINRRDTPNLAAYLDTATVANLSVRTIGPRTSLAEGYATIGAGNRATVVEEFAGQAFNDTSAADAFGSYTSSAADVWQRRLRRASGEASGDVVHTAFATVEAANRKLRYGSVVGTLGESLGPGGGAVVAQADAPSSPGQPEGPGAEAALAVVDRSGTTDGVVTGLLRRDSKLAFGVGLDPALVLDAIDTIVAAHPLTLVELSDLERADQERSFSLPRPGRRMWRRSLEQSDRLFGRLLGRLPKNVTVMLVAPAAPRAREQLTVFAMSGPNIRPGLAQSGTTRRAGYVTLPDIGPAILGQLHAQIPTDMVGTAITSGSSGDTRPVRFVRDSARATFRDRATGPAIATFVVLQVLIYLAVGVALLRRRRDVLRVLAVLALGILAIPPLGFLAGLVPVERLGVVGFVVVLHAAGFLVGAAAAVLGRGRRPLVAPVTLAAISLLVQLVDVATGGRLQLNTVFGYSPVVAGRFAGFGNLSFALVACTAIVVAAGLFGLIGSRRAGFLAAFTLLAVVVLLDGLPTFGSDVGGVLASVPAFVVLGLLLAGRALDWRKLALAAFGAAVLLAGFATLDVLRPADRRTHLGRLVARVADDPSALGDVIIRKIEANVSILTSSVWTLILPAAILLLVVVLWRSPGFLRTLERQVPVLRPALVAAVVGGGLGFALNDSGVVVPAMMLGVVLPLVTWLLGVTGATDRRISL